MRLRLGGRAVLGMFSQIVDASGPELVRAAYSEYVASRRLPVMSAESHDEGNDPMSVLIWCENHILSGLMAQNLAQRGFDVADNATVGESPPAASRENAPQLIIVDLESQELDVWHRAEGVRAEAPGIPLIFLGHPWPNARQLKRLQPCTYIRKPFAIGALLSAVQDALAEAASSR